MCLGLQAAILLTNSRLNVSAVRRPFFVVIVIVNVSSLPLKWLLSSSSSYVPLGFGVSVHRDYHRYYWALSLSPHIRHRWRQQWRRWWLWWRQQWRRRWRQWWSIATGRDVGSAVLFAAMQNTRSKSCFKPQHSRKMDRPLGVICMNFGADGCTDVLANGRRGRISMPQGILLY